MILSFKEIIKYSKKINQKIAFETEALWIKTFIINAETNEFDNFSKVSFRYWNKFKLSYLNLASKAFNFSRSKFIKRLKDML